MRLPKKFKRKWALALASVLGFLVLGVWIVDGLRAGDMPVLRVALWDGYQDMEFARQFEERFGIRVEFDVYTSNEELIAKLEAGVGEYDVVYPSDYAVSILIEKGLLRDLGPSLAPNGRVESRFLGQSHDTENRFSLPIGWGTTGFAVRSDQPGRRVRAWADLVHSPEFHEKYVLLDDLRETLGSMLLWTGHSLNSTTPSHLKDATASLRLAWSRARGVSSEPMRAIIEGEAIIAHSYSNDAFRAMAESDLPIDYVLPREGASFWVDSVAVPRSARRPETALQWVDFVTDPERSLQFAHRHWLGAVVSQNPLRVSAELTAARATSGVRARYVRYLQEASKARLERIQNLGAEANDSYRRAWKRAALH